MGWNPIVIDVANVPHSNLDDVAVSNEADALRNASGKFESLTTSLTRSWGGLAHTYMTGHTQVVLSKMDNAKATAARAQWVYDQAAWALDAFAAEMRDLRYQANDLERAVRALLRRPDAQVKAAVPGTYEFNTNFGCWRNAHRIAGAMRSAMEMCRVRLDAIGQDPHAFDPYDGLTEVTRDGTGFTDYVDVEAKPLEWNLFGTTGAISGSQVDQGNLGNCWFMSSLAALADKDPSAIERMVRDNRNGTYTVTLFVEGEWQSIQVDNTMLIGENGKPRFSGNGAYNDEALWPLLVEKAAIKAYGGDYVALNAGTGAMSMELFTGNSAKTDFITPNAVWDRDAIARYSEMSQRDDVIMTANSNISANTDWFDIPVTRTREHPDMCSVDVVEGTVSFSNNHVYQVADIDPQGNVTLVEPNNRAGMVDGIDEDRFTITAEQFQEHFVGVSVGTTS